MGLPSGLLWAPVNLDISQPGGFAENPFRLEASYFSWGNTDGHNPTSPSSFAPYSFGNVNAQSPWYEGQVYGSTPGYQLSSDITLENDAAHIILGDKWRIPSAADYMELMNNCVFLDAEGNDLDPEAPDKRVTLNDCPGIYLKSVINGSRLFIPLTGSGGSSTLSYLGTSGYLWCTDYIDEKSAKRAQVGANGLSVAQPSSRCFGFAIRAVYDLSLG